MSTAKTELKFPRRTFLVGLHLGALALGLGGAAAWWTSSKGKQSSLVEKLEREAAQGNILSLLTLAREYYHGVVIPQDKLKALAGFEEAAEADSDAAMLLGGAMLLQGDGVPKKEVRGARWIRRSAEHGSPMGMYHLSELLVQGQGVGKDALASRAWLEKAARASCIPAMLALAKVYEEEGRFTQAQAWYLTAVWTGKKGMYRDVYDWYGKPHMTALKNHEVLAKFMAQAEAGKQAMTARLSVEDQDTAKTQALVLHKDALAGADAWGAAELKRGLKLVKARK